MQVVEFKVAFIGNFANRISGNPHKKYVCSKMLKLEIKLHKEHFINPPTMQAVELQKSA